MLANGLCIAGQGILAAAASLGRFLRPFIKGKMI